MPNPLCECPAAGFCTRHLLVKNAHEHSLCNGTATNGDCGTKYWTAWELGKLGATAPDNPVPYPPPFCSRKSRGAGDRVASAIHTVSRGLVHTCCGCSKRQAKLNHYFPAEAPPILPHKFFWDYTTRNLLYFIWPVIPPYARNKPGTYLPWQWNVDELLRRSSIFNGQKHIAIVTSPDCSPLPEVRERLAPLNPTSFTILPNNKRLREVVAFVPLLGQLAPDESNPNLTPLAPLDSITFFAHSKGVRHNQPHNTTSSTIFQWTKLQYESCLDYPELILQGLTNHGITGSFKRYGQFTTPRNNRWHYSGTYYWFRDRDVFQRNWRYIDKKFFGAESWPGHMFQANEASHLFYDNVEDLYNYEYFHNTILPAYQQWTHQNESENVFSANYKQRLRQLYLNLEPNAGTSTAAPPAGT